MFDLLRYSDFESLVKRPVISMFAHLRIMLIPLGNSFENIPCKDNFLNDHIFNRRLKNKKIHEVVFVLLFYDDVQRKN